MTVMNAHMSHTSTCLVYCSPLTLSITLIVGGIVTTWVLMAELIQGLQDGWQKPWFIMYVIHSAYSITLIPWYLFRHVRLQAAAASHCKTAVPTGDNQLLLDSRLDGGTNILADTTYDTAPTATASTSPLPFRQLVVTGILLSVLSTFVALTWYVSLNSTLVGLNNAIYQASCCVVFVFGYVAGLEEFSWTKAVSVAICIGGAAMAYLLADSSSGPVTQTVSGYVYVVISMTGYALYEVVYAYATLRSYSGLHDVLGRHCCSRAATLASCVQGGVGTVGPARPAAISTAAAVKAETAALVLGIMGVSTFLCQWPLFFIFHATGFETFVTPGAEKVRLVALNAGLDTLYNGLLLLGIALAGPLAMSIASMLVVPASLIADWLLHGVVPTAGSCVGMVLILGGFALMHAPLSASKCTSRMQAWASR